MKFIYQKCISNLWRHRKRRISSLARAVRANMQVRLQKQLKNLFPSADQVGKFIVFNISGNHYRLIAFVRYPLKRIYIRHILTHQEYDQEKWKEDEWFKNSKN